MGAPLLALLDGEARQRGPTQAEVLAAADPLVRRLLRGVALEAERAALRNGEAHVAHEAAAAATVAAAEGAEGEPEAVALRKALAAQGEALRRAEAAVAEREVAISRLEAEVRQAEATAQRAQAAVEVQAHEIDRRRGPPRHSVREARA